MTSLRCELIAENPDKWRLLDQLVYLSTDGQTLIVPANFEVGSPLREHAAHDDDLLTFENFAQLLLVKPSTGGALGGDEGSEEASDRAGIRRRAIGSFSSFQRKPLRLGSLFCSMRRVASTASWRGR
ncbi:MAG: hypothetical protein IPI44_06890 [Sulfuritalea sp.]|nr:hypothetical protein [Sulfuritalea sp.]